MAKRVYRLFSKPDACFNIEKFGVSDNVLFITGLFGSGKSYTGRLLSKKYNATLLMQDWLTWSKCYSSPESKFFVNMFISLYPETEIYFKNDMWHDQVDKKAKKGYRIKYNEMILDYTSKHKDQLFIFEGSDILNMPNYESILAGRPLIVKRTSVRKSFLNLKMRDRGKINIKESYKLWKKYKKYYINYHKVVNNFIKTMTNLNKG